MALRLVEPPDLGPATASGDDPRDPQLYRAGLSSAREALRAGVARRHERRVADGSDGSDGAGGAGRPAVDAPEGAR